MEERREVAPGDTEPMAEDLDARRAAWHAWKRASKRALGLGVALAFLVAGAVLYSTLELLTWPAWLAWPLGVLAFLVAFVVTVLLATPDRPAWPPRHPEYDAAPEPVGKLSRLAYELSERPWRDMQVRRSERRRLASQQGEPGASNRAPAAVPGSRTRQLVVLVVAVLGLLLLVGVAVASVTLLGSSRKRHREERRKELERFERELPSELREEWEEHKRSGR